MNKNVVAIPPRKYIGGASDRQKPVVDLRKYVSRKWLVQALSGQEAASPAMEFKQRGDAIWAAAELAYDHGVFQAVWEQRFAEVEGRLVVVDVRLVQVVHADPRQRAKRTMHPEWRSGESWSFPGLPHGVSLVPPARHARSRRAVSA